jgi:four helix bundle protein
MAENVFRFQEFPVYKAARQFRKDLKNLTKKLFPKEEQYCLTQQLWRALDSIMLNIAEGSGRLSDVDFSRFLNNALTSLNEVVACLDAAIDDKYIDEKDYTKFVKTAENIFRQLKAFVSKVRKDDLKH